LGNRPIHRKVIIVYEGRDPNDSAGLLRAVADELRPREVEIRVKSPSPGADPPTQPDEQLETRATEHAADVLDQKDRELRSAPKEAASVPADPAQVLATKRRRVIVWLGRLVAGGWRFTLKVLPVVEQVAKIYKDFKG
jgi:hypothetical protein